MNLMIIYAKINGMSTIELKIILITYCLLSDPVTEKSGVLFYF